MSNVDTVLQWLESELEFFKAEGRIKLHLCISGGFIRCCPTDHSPKVHPILYRFTSKQIESGFSRAEWSELAQILLTHLRLNPLCKHR